MSAIIECKVKLSNGRPCGYGCRNQMDLILHWRARHPEHYEKARQLARKLAPRFLRR